MSRQINRVGLVRPRGSSHFFNRTGSTVLRGTVLMCDMDAGATETTSTISEDEDGPYANVVTPIAADINKTFPIVVADEDIKDNTVGRCWTYGVIEIATVDDDVATTDVEQGDMVNFVAQGGSFGLQGWLTNTRALGLALEAGAAASSDTDRLYDASNHLRWIDFDGRPGNAND